jgi:hypothetical protein
MTVVAADRQDGPVAQDFNNLEDMVRHHPDDPRCRTIRWPAPMRPVASEIVFGSGIAADQLAHFPPAPGGWASIGKFVRGIVLIRNARVMMKMMATQRGCARTVRRRHLKARGKQKDKPEFHYALQRVETAVRPSWLDVSCGEAGRLIDQCGDKRASILTNFGTRRSSYEE